jgi:glycosyltransferase involved in cell wall biosynthesis
MSGRSDDVSDVDTPDVDTPTRDDRTGRPLVSVVIPTYAHADLVEETLDSVFAQTYRHLEVIVVNDGSPDDTAKVLEPIAATGRMRYVEQENRGQGAARNRGLADATGRYVAFLDDDDLWPPDKLAWQVARLQADAGAVMAYGHHGKLLPDGTLEVDDPIPYRPSGDALREFRLRNWLLSPGQTLMRTSDVRALGGFDPAIWGSDDWDLYVRLAARGRFLFEPRVALHYRLHGGNASRQAIRHARNHMRVAWRHIGWNLPLLVRHQRLAAGYFVPNLLRLASEKRAAGEHDVAVRADLHALCFRPSLAVRPWYLKNVLRSRLGRPAD